MSVLPAGAPLEFRILGELEVRAAGRPLPLGAPKQRTLTAMLLVHPNAVVALRTITEELWGDTPPKSATANIRTYAARFRAALPPAERDRLVVRPLGYQLRIAADELDLTVFQSHAGSGRAALHRGDFAEAVWHLDRALRMWRGRLAEDVRAGATLAAREVALDEERLSAEEDRCEALLNIGRYAPAIGVLRATVAAYPLRERAWALLMRTLYAAHDTGGALTAFAEARSALVESLGIEPGEELQELHRAMLRRDTRLARITPPAELAVPRQLPPKPPLAGRDGELRQLTTLLDPDNGTGVVGVFGSPGAGKSSLAVHAAHLVTDRYPDGQLYADLRGTGLEPRRVLDRFLEVLGVPAGQRPVDVDAAAALYRSLLTGRRMLVVLDNAADVTQVRPLLVSAPGTVVLATSGPILSTIDGARHVRLLELTESGSLDLLAEFAGRARVSRELVAATRLVHLCGRLPMALRIAAARLAEHPDWSLRDLVRRLADPGHCLDELETGDLSLRRCLRAPYDRLAGSERAPDQKAARTFRLLGSGPLDTVDPEQVAAFSGTAVSRVVRSLDRLVEVHLLNQGYRLPHLTGLLAAEVAAAPEPPNGARMQTVARSGNGSRDR